MYAKSFIALDGNGRLTGARTAQRYPYDRYTCHLCGSALQYRVDASRIQQSAFTADRLDDTAKPLRGAHRASPRSFSTASAISSTLLNGCGNTLATLPSASIRIDTGRTGGAPTAAAMRPASSWTPGSDTP